MPVNNDTLSSLACVALIRDQKVLSSRKLDHSYALALLLLLPVDVGKQKILEARPHTLSSYTKAKVSISIFQPINRVYMVCVIHPGIVSTSYRLRQLVWATRHGEHITVLRYCCRLGKEIRKIQGIG